MRRERLERVRARPSAGTEVRFLRGSADNGSIRVRVGTRGLGASFSAVRAPQNALKTKPIYTARLGCPELKRHHPFSPCSST